jgi:hypothetical protein
MSRADAAYRRFLGTRLRFYLVWVSLIVLAILMWAWRWVASDDVPFWSTLLADGSLVFAVMLPLQGAFFGRRQAVGGGRAQTAGEPRNPGSPVVPGGEELDPEQPPL